MLCTCVSTIGSGRGGEGDQPSLPLPPFLLATSMALWSGSGLFLSHSVVVQRAVLVRSSTCGVPIERALHGRSNVLLLTGPCHVNCSRTLPCFKCWCTCIYMTSDVMILCNIPLLRGHPASFREWVESYVVQSSVQCGWWWTSKRGTRTKFESFERERYVMRDIPYNSDE